MSGTHGVFQHRTGYFYTILEEDFCELYKADGVNEVCRAYITSILENLTNKQYEATGSDKDIWVFMSIPEMARRMRHAFGERTIHKELQGMIKDGYLQKRRATGKATMEYKLNLKKLRSALDALPEKQPCNSATYHLAILQDQSGKNATLTLQNSKNDLAELQPRISNRLQREEIENTESTYATSDEDRNAPTDMLTGAKNWYQKQYHREELHDTLSGLNEAIEDVDQAQQGDEHATIPSRSDDRFATGASHRASSSPATQTETQAEVGGPTRPQASHAALGTISQRAGLPGEARISDDPKTSHDLDDVFRGNAAVSGHSGEALRGAAAEEVSNVLAPVSGAPARAQSGDSARGIADRVQSGGTLRRDTVPEAASLPTQASSTTPVERTVRQTPSSLPPNGDGAVGSAPQSSGPRRSGKGKTQVQDVTQALSLQGAQVKEWMETIKGRKRRMTPKNILAWNALAEEEDISFENLRDAIAKLESIKWVQEHDYVIDEQVLSQEGGNFTFSKGMELVRRKPKAASPEQFTSKTLDKERNDKRIAEMIEKSQKIRAEREAAQTTGK